MKRKAFGLKIISFFLSVVVTVACLPATANSLNTNAVDVSTEVVEPTITDPVIIDPIFEEAKIESATLEQLTSRAPDEKTVYELQEMEVDTSSLPSFIEANYALQKGHVNRLKSAEKNLNTVVFQNKDGTETTYIFIRPVKYVDENGEVKDKSDKIAPIIHATYSYGVLNNNSKIYFPKNVTAGTKIQYQNYTIQMTPVTTYSASPTYLNETEVAYNGVFGTNTVLKYQTKLNGLKEDIVLVKNTGLNEFDFTLTLTNLTPVLIDNIWYLKNSGDEIIASLGRIIIKDSNGNSTEGSMTISPSTARNTYAVKIIVPADFLSADSTVYPVYVDPSTTIFETDSYYNEYGYLCSYNAILDTGMYTTAEAVANAEANQDYHNSSITGKIVYKLYDFYGENGQYTTLRSSQIGNAFLHINVGSGASATLTVNPMLGTWNQATYGEDPIAISDFMIWMAYSTEISSSLYLDSTGGRRSINITDIVRGWADYNNGESSVPYNNPEYGFVLSSDLTSPSRTIAAVEEFYANSVYVTLDTSNLGGSYYLVNAFSGKFLKLSSPSAKTSHYMDSNSIRLYLEYLGENQFYIRSMRNKNYVLYGDNDCAKMGVLPENPTDDYIWTVANAIGGGVTLKCIGNDNYVLKHDGETLSLVPAVASTDASYKQTVWGAISQENYVNLTSFTIENIDWLSINDTPQNSTIVVFPSNATHRTANWFNWESSVPSVAAVDASGRITPYGNGYTNIIVTHKPTRKTYIFPIIVEQMIPNGTYQIKNVSSGKYAVVEGPSNLDGASIQQWDYHTGNHSKWHITYVGSGYYKIKSAYSNKYLAVDGGSPSSGAAIVQTSADSEMCRWKLTLSSAGNYIFTAKSAGSDSVVLSLPYESTDNGVDLVQQTYTQDAVRTDEWFLLYDAALLAIIHEDGARRDFFIDNVRNQLNAIDAFSTHLSVYSSEFTKTEMESILSTSKFFAIHTHGEVNKFAISKNYTGYFVNDIKNTDLSNLKLAVFLTCLGGFGEYDPNNVINGTPYNLVEACIYSGAETAVAFNQNTSFDACNVWLSNLLKEMRLHGYTLQEAIDVLDDDDFSFGEDTFEQRCELSEVAVIGGNDSITLSDIFS